MAKTTTILPDTAALISIPKDTILQKNEIITSHVEEKKDKKKKKTTGKTNIENADSKLTSFKNNFMKFAPYASFLLIPFFALLVNLFFNKREYFYIDHFVFALHFHAFIFFLFTLFIIASMIFPNYDFEVYFFFYIPIIYLIWAIWVVYRPRIRTLVFKITAIFIFYGIAIISVIVSLFIIAAKLSKMDEVLKEAMSYT